MTPEQITSIGAVLMADIERFPEARRIHAGERDGYKPFYRGISCALSMVQEKHKALATSSEVESLLRQAHPWYAKALDGEFDLFNEEEKAEHRRLDITDKVGDSRSNRGTFNHLYQFHAELYDEED